MNESKEMVVKRAYRDLFSSSNECQKEEKVSIRTLTEVREKGN